MNKSWELTDEEMYLIIGGDKKLLKRFGKARVAREYHDITQAAQKKLVEHLKKVGEPVEDSEVAPQKQKTDWLIPEDKWQALCKKLEVK